MNNTAIAEELSELRALVEELRQARKDDQKEDLVQEHEGVTVESIKKVVTEKLAIGDAETHIHDFVTTLEEDIKDTNPMTILVLFSLGVVVGRLLSK